MAAELIARKKPADPERESGVSMTHIPYKSDQDVTREVAAGSVQVGLTIAQLAIPPVIDRINDAVNKGATMPDVVSRMRDALFSEPATGSPAGFRQYLETEIAKWREVGNTVKSMARARAAKRCRGSTAGTSAS